MLGNIPRDFFVGDLDGSIAPIKRIPRVARVPEIVYAVEPYGFLSLDSYLV